MAKKKTRRKRSGDVNKSEEIRNVFKAKGPDFRPKDLIAHLAGKGIEVSPAQVSNVKAALYRGTGVRRRGRPSSNAMSVGALQQAKALVDQVGSVTAAKQALDVLETLR